MINFGPKTFLFPQPVLIISTYDKDKNPNAMNAAWGGIYDTNQIYICLASHKTTDNIKLNGEFVVQMGVKEYTAECDYLGIESGNKEPNKLLKSGLTVRKSENINAPIINELPLALECKLVKIIDEEHYIADIVNVVCDDNIITDGKIDLNKFHPITYDPANHGYYELGNKVGNAFTDGLKYKKGE